MDLVLSSDLEKITKLATIIDGSSFSLEDTNFKKCDSGLRDAQN
jgi:hypothetical protein